MRSHLAENEPDPQLPPTPEALKRARTCPRAREAVVLACSPLIRRIAKHHADQGLLEYDDAEQAGTVGVLRAIDEVREPEAWLRCASLYIRAEVQLAAGITSGHQRPRPRLVAVPGSGKNPEHDPMPDRDRERLLDAAGLDERERRVLAHLLTGATQEEAAAEVGISVRTVKRTVADIRDKVTAARERDGRPVAAANSRPRCADPFAAPVYRIPTDLEREQAFAWARYVSPLGRMAVEETPLQWAKHAAPFVTDGQWRQLEQDPELVERDAAWPQGTGAALVAYLGQQAKYLARVDLGDPSPTRRKRLIGRGILDESGELTPFGEAIARTKEVLRCAA